MEHSLSLASPDGQDLAVNVAQIDEILELLAIDQFDLNAISPDYLSPTFCTTDTTDAYSNSNLAASWTASSPSAVSSLFGSPQSAVIDSFLVADMWDTLSTPQDLQAISPDILLPPLGLPPLDMDPAFDNHLNSEYSPVNTTTTITPTTLEQSNPGPSTAPISSSQQQHQSQHQHQHQHADADADADPTAATTPTLRCPHCGTSHATKTKLAIHINTKHTKPYRCAAAGCACAYATGEKKSWQRHLVARAKWDEAHREAADREGLVAARHQCGQPGCTYVTLRADNFKRHERTCRGGQKGRA